MSVLVFVEDWNGSFKKASFEATSYAKRWANMMNTQVVAVTSNGVVELVNRQSFQDTFINDL